MIINVSTWSSPLNPQQRDPAQASQQNPRRKQLAEETRCFHLKTVVQMPLSAHAPVLLHCVSAHTEASVITVTTNRDRDPEAGA